MNKLETSIDKAFAAGDFTDRQRTVMRALLEQGAAQHDLYLIISRLAELVEMDPAAVAGILKAMTKRNILVATPRREGLRPYSYRIASPEQWKQRELRGSIPKEVPNGVFAIRA
jgi:DNA-binding MarR family transcriptional regulator